MSLFQGWSGVVCAVGAVAAGMALMHLMRRRRNDLFGELKTEFEEHQAELRRQREERRREQARNARALRKKKLLG